MKEAELDEEKQVFYLNQLPLVFKSQESDVQNLQEVSKVHDLDLLKTDIFEHSLRAKKLLEELIDKKSIFKNKACQEIETQTEETCEDE